VDLWAKATLKSLLVPGGVLLLAAIALFWSGLVTVPSAGIDFYYYAAFGAAILLAWRFHSSRILFTLLTLLLAYRAVAFFSHGHIAATGPGRIAFEAVALLIPLNFLGFSVKPEDGLSLRSLTPGATLIFFESVFVAVICRPEAVRSPGFFHPDFLGRQSWTRLPQLALIIFGIAFALLLLRFLLHRKPAEIGLLWSLAAAFLSLQSGGVGRIPTAFMGTAAVILLASIIENSYLLAYYDELTGLPARRAFNEAVLHLEAPYTIAAVDIDHFKRVNDTHGHETGDQVLRMVGHRLADVTGGGRAYRVGGEEFTILFPGKSLPETMASLDMLRCTVEDSVFRLRGGEERRRPAPLLAQDRADRRKRMSGDRRAPAITHARSRCVGQADGMNSLSVTISIGAASADSRARKVEPVIQAADKALYRAKQNGRNRIEYAGKSPRRRLTRHSVA